MLKREYTWVVDADLKSYFDTIPHEQLLARVGEKISDSRVLTLVESYLNQDIMETTRNWAPETGTPQGAVISPLLSNIYLDPLDQLMAQQGFEMTRYADDFIVQCRSEREAQLVLELIQEWVDGAGLTLHPEKTRLVDASQRGGFDFLGYHFERGYRWPSDKSLKRLKDNVRSKTRRNNGHSLEAIIVNLNRSTRGWFEYFKHSHRTTFPDSTSGSECACGAFSVDVGTGKAGDVARIINAGPTPSLPSMGCSHLSQPMQRPVSPLGGEPPTGEPCAGEPHARFGGRGPRVTGDPYPYNGQFDALPCEFFPISVGAAYMPPLLDQADVSEQGRDRSRPFMFYSTPFPEL